MSSTIVISEVYGGGGNSGAPYRNDFVELFNRGAAAVSLAGWSVQYASATGTGNFAANPVTALSGSLAPGQYYLVQLASGGASGVPLPTPDATGTASMSATAGKVALVNSTTGLACNGGSTPCSPAQLAQIVDLVGWGNANFFEGAAGPATASTTALLRHGGGCTETDNNSADFTAGPPNPRNTASPLSPCAQPPTVTTHPVGQVACDGQPVSFVAAASGSPAPSVQWQVSTDGGAAFVDIPGAGSTTLGFTATVTQNGYRYRAVFINLLGTATSEPAALTVNSAPVVTAQPLDQAVGDGEAVSFVAAASGSPAPTVQWQVSTDGGAAFVDIPAAVGPTLDFGATVTQTGYRYRAAFSNACGTATTEAATLTVTVPPVVISQVYGGGGNLGSTLKNDFIELFNPGSAAVSLEGWSVQYASTVGVNWFRTNLSGTIAPGQYYLIEQWQGAGGTLDLPAPDAAGTIAIDQAAAKVVLVTNQTTIPPGTVCPSGPAIVDLMGYGAGTNCFEGAGPAPTLSNPTAGLRAGEGCIDSDNNSADFTVGPPNPRNTASPLNACTAPVVTAQPVDLTVADGEAASFSAAASGSPGPTVQWQVSIDGGSTWGDVPGATGTTLEFTATVGQTGYQYRAAFTNALGTATSGGAALTVTAFSPVWAEASWKGSVPASGASVVPGDRIDYAIHYENTGNGDATGVVVRDAVPEGAVYVVGSATSSASVAVEFLVGGSFQSEEPPDGGMVQGLRWLIGEVPAGGGGHLGFAVTVAAPLPDGSRIDNSAEVVSEQTPGGVSLGPVSHRVGSAPEIGLVKSVSDTDLDVIAEGAALVYALRLHNGGDEVATRVRVVDGPPPGTTLAAVDDGGLTVQCSTDGVAFGGCPADLSAVSVVEWSAPSLDTTGAFVFGFTVMVDLAVSDGAVLRNVAAAETDQTGRALSNEVSTTIRVRPETITTAPVMSLAKAVTPSGTVTAGEVVSYTLSWANTGTAAALDVVVDDPIPEGGTYVAGSATGAPLFLVGGSYQPGEPADPATVQGLRWVEPALAAGESRTVAFLVRLDRVAAEAESVQNTARLMAAWLAPVSASVLSPLGDVPELAVTKTALQSVARPGDLISYRIEVVVAGGGPAGPVIVVDRIPPGTEFVSASEGGTYAGGEVTWDLGVLPPGPAIRLLVTLRLVGDFAHGEVVANTVAVSASGAEGASAAARTVVKAPAVLQVTKTIADGTLDAGQQAVYTITVRNTGEGIATGVILEDALPDALQFVSSFPTPDAAEPLRWHLGDLAPGAEVAVTLIAQPRQAGRVVNTATVLGANAPPVAGSAVLDVAALPMTGLEARRLGLIGLTMLSLGALLLALAGKWGRRLSAGPGGDYLMGTERP